MASCLCFPYDLGFPSLLRIQNWAKMAMAMEFRSGVSRCCTSPFNTTTTILHRHDASLRISRNRSFRSSSLCADAALSMTNCIPQPISRLSSSRHSTIVCSATKDSGRVNENERGFEKKIEAFGEALAAGFPFWIMVACAGGLTKPSAFTWIQGQVQIVGVSITMLGMGMTISLDDLKGALAMPKELVAGVLLQYTVMPTAGALISWILKLPAHYAAGLILVACCPGGTSSNVVTYLAKGNVALSVLMTAASTFLAVVMTPMLTSRLVGQYVAVDAGSLFFSTLQVVLLPVTVGVLLAQYLPGLVRRVTPLAPSFAVLVVSVICAGAVSQSASSIRQSGGQVLAAAIALHVAGFLFGYLLSHIFGFEESTSRTISIEVGMQNSVLGVVLASRHFGSPLTAVPCAVSSFCHPIIGSALARFWRSRTAKLPTVDDAVSS